MIVTAIGSLVAAVTLGYVVLRDLRNQAAAVADLVLARLDQVRPGSFADRVVSSLQLDVAIDEWLSRVPSIVVVGNEGGTEVGHQLVSLLAVVILAAFFQSSGRTIVDWVVARWPRDAIRPRAARCPGRRPCVPARPRAARHRLRPTLAAVGGSGVGCGCSGLLTVRPAGCGGGGDLGRRVVRGTGDRHGDRIVADGGAARPRPAASGVDGTRHRRTPGRGGDVRPAPVDRAGDTPSRRRPVRDQRRSRHRHRRDRWLADRARARCGDLCRAHEPVTAEPSAALAARSTARPFDRRDHRPDRLAGRPAGGGDALDGRADLGLPAPSDAGDRVAADRRLRGDRPQPTDRVARDAHPAHPAGGGGDAGGRARIRRRGSDDRRRRRRSPCRRRPSPNGSPRWSPTWRTRD